MQFTKLSLLAAAVSGVIAQPQPTAVVDKRQDLANCSSLGVKYSTIFDAMPTPNDGALSVLLKVTASVDCEIPAVTGTHASDYSSYWSQATSWQGKYKSQYAEVASACINDIGAIFTSASVENPLAKATACSTFKWGPTESAQSTNGANSRRAGSAIAVVALAGLTAVGLF